MPKIKPESCAVLLLLLVAVVVPGSARATDADEGLRLAEQWCASCHAIAPGRASKAPAPPFAAIVNERGRSDAWIGTWLSTPHQLMPDLALTRAEIAALVAYFDSLRSGQ